MTMLTMTTMKLTVIQGMMIMMMMRRRRRKPVNLVRIQRLTINS